MRRLLVLTMVLFVGLLCPFDAQAKDKAKDKDKGPFTERPKWRFEFDNDSFTGGDDAFSAGWSVQRHSAWFDTWEQKKKGKKRKGFALWVGEHFPGLGDDGEGGRVVRRAQGYTGLMQTPEDVANPDPQPEDVPWAGVAGFASSWSSYDNRRLAAFQIFVGCMGPCSGADEIQTFIHDDLGLGTPPEGWDNQLDDEALGNLNYALRYKLLAPSEDRYQAGRGGGDLSIGGQIGVGNYFTFVEGQLEFRFGRGLPMGFTHIPDPPGRGIMLDPAYIPAGETTALDRTRLYFSLVPRFVYFEEIKTLEGGETENGGFHPGVDYDDSMLQVLFGFHIARRSFAAHLTAYFFPDDVIDVASGTATDWVNLSLEWRF